MVYEESVIQYVMPVRVGAWVRRVMLGVRGRAWCVARASPAARGPRPRPPRPRDARGPRRAAGVAGVRGGRAVGAQVQHPRGAHQVRAAARDRRALAPAGRGLPRSAVCYTAAR